MCFVHNERLVNLQVLTHKGHACGASSVPLQQDDDPTYAQGVAIEAPFCEWMPFQKGQAAKTEQLERAGAAPAADEPDDPGAVTFAHENGDGR